MDIYCVTLDSSMVTFKDNEDAIIVNVLVIKMMVFFLQGRSFWVQDPIVSLAQTHFTLIFSFFFMLFFSPFK